MRSLLMATLAATMLAGPALADDDRRGWRGDDRREWRDDRRNDYRHIRGDYRRDARNDWRWSGDRYRGPIYVHPRGHVYRNWNVGYRVPAAYVGQRYWIGNPDYYRLPPAWRGARWVRVGPDALLVRVGDGVIVQAVRGLYW